MPSVRLSNALKDGPHPVYSLLDSIVTSTSTLHPDSYNFYEEGEAGVDGEAPWFNGAFQPPTDRHQHPQFVLMLIVVASLSLVVGAIYMLIYFKSIKPMSARSRSYVDQGGKADDDGGRSKSAHPFFRRK